MITIHKIAFVLFAVLAFTNYTNAQSNQDNTSIQKYQSDTAKVTYKLKAFKQSCCSYLVNFALEEVDGFVRSEANIKKQEITIWYKPEKCTEKELKKAINKTAYKVVE